MKKNKRLLSLCLGLVLVLGVSACDDLTDILGDLGSDDTDISTDLEEDDGDNNNDTSESNISYTYSVAITNEDELTPLVVEGDTVTAKVELVTTTHHRVKDEGTTSKVDATADDVVLQSSADGVLEIDGLTINPIGAGTTTLTAYWEEHDATSSGVEITVSEPDSYTYVLEINNKESYTDLTTESTLDDVSITLTTYKNGVVDGTPETGSSETVSLVSSDTDVITVESGSLSLTVVGAGSTIITAYWIGHEDEESAKDTIAITVSEPTSGGGEEPGGGDTGGQGGDEGGGSGEGGDDDEPGGGEPETVYISTLTFDQTAYELDLEENTTASFTVTALGPDGATPSDPTAYSVEIVDTSVAAIEEGVIVAKEVGTTTIKAYSTDNPGSAVYGCASITVTLGYEPVTSFSVSPTDSITLNVGGSVTLGYGENDDYKVSVTPETATKTGFTLSGTTDQYLTISEKGSDNTYTITAPNDVEGAGAELRTYTLTITSDDPNSTASKEITVIISEIPEVAHPVTSITLTGEVTVSGDTYTKTISHTGSFTIGPTGSGADVIASVNEDAYDTSINVSSEDKSYISISEPDENGVYTVTVTDTGDDEQTATITIESAVNPSVSTTLTLTISQAESRISSISINPTSIDMLTDDSLTLGTTNNELTVTISDQYGQEVSGAEWEAAISSSSDEGVISSIDTTVANQITITTGTTVGTGLIDFSVKDHSDVTPATLTVNVTQHYYDIDTITYNGSSEVTLTYDLGTEPVGSDVTISGNDITYSSQYGPVISNDADFALYSEDTAHIKIEDKTITALLPTEDPVTVYIYLVGSSDVYTTISVTVSDVTEYGVTSLSVSATTTEIKAGETKTLAELGVEVIYTPSYTTELEYTVTSNSPEVLAVTGTYGSYSLTASSGLRTDTDVTLTFTSTSNDQATDTLNIKVTNDYVAVTSVTLDASTLSLTYGGTTGGTATITATVNPSNATDAGVITWNSSNTSAVTISGSGASVTLTAAGTGTSEITASCGGVTSTACTVTVEQYTYFETFTYRITFTHDGDTLAAAGEGIDLYAKGEFNGTWNESGWWEYGEEVKLTNNGDGTYDFTLSYIPENDRKFDIYVDDTVNNKHEDDWMYVLGSYTITGLDQDEKSPTGVVLKEIEIESSYASIEDLLHPSNLTDFYVVLIDGVSSTSSGEGQGGQSGGQGGSSGPGGNQGGNQGSTSGSFSSLTDVKVQDSTWVDHIAFGNSASTTTTVTTTGAGQTCVTFSEAGSVSAGTELYFLFNGNSWGYEVDTSLASIPSVDSDSYAVWVVVGTSAYMTKDSHWATYEQEESICGWYTVSNSTSISSFISTQLTSAVYY